MERRGAGGAPAFAASFFFWAMGIYQMGWSTGIFLGPPLAGWLAEAWGLPVAFLTGAAASVAAAALGGWLWLKDRGP